MKKLIITLAGLVIMGGIMAQEHLTFKGVPINGTLKQYTAAMVKAGFKSEGTTSNGIALLTGDFAGYKGCIVGVSTLSSCDIVNRISVLFPEKDTWSTLLYDYENLKELLTVKYGEPDYNVERFTDYHGNDSRLKMYAINDREIEWYTIFSTELGEIELTLVGGTHGHQARVRLSYTDKANSETVRQNVLDDL